MANMGNNNLCNESLKTCFNQIQSIFNDQNSTFLNQLKDLQQEVLSLKMENKDLRERINNEKSEVFNHEMIINKELEQKIGQLEEKLEQSYCELNKWHQKCESVKQKCQKKVKEWSSYFEYVKANCVCEFRKKLQSDSFPGNCKEKLTKLSESDHMISDIRNTYPGVNRKQTNLSKIFMSPIKTNKENSIIALAPMTEQYDDSVGHYASTPVLVGETEQHPEADYIEIGSDDETAWLSSPSLISNNFPLRDNKNNYHHSNSVNTNKDEIFDFKKPTTFPLKQLETPKGPKVKKRVLETSADLFSDTSPVPNCPNQSSNVDLKPKVFTAGTTVETVKISEKQEVDSFFNELVDKQPYKFSEVVRKKNDREKLNGYDCRECRQYYAGDNLTEEQLKLVLKNCSKHRHQSTPPPDTPEDFWEVGFPNTQECIEKGLMFDENQTLPDYAKPMMRKGKSRKRIKYQ